MAEIETTPAWIALFLGLYSLAAGVGELRQPGSWVAMLRGFESNPSLRYLTGIFCVTLGAAIYLVTPWNPGDWLAIVISALGGLCAAEGLLILAFGERFLAYAGRLIGKSATLWAGFSCLIGAAFLFVALARLQTI